MFMPGMTNSSRKNKWCQLVTYTALKTIVKLVNIHIYKSLHVELRFSVLVIKLFGQSE